MLSAGQLLLSCEMSHICYQEVNTMHPCTGEKYYFIEITLLHEKIKNKEYVMAKYNAEGIKKLYYVTKVKKNKKTML